MIVQRGYKTELDLNDQQRSACEQHVGVARFAYNWGLARKIEAYQETGKSPNAKALHKELNAHKRTEFPWMYAVSKCAPQEALRNLDVAYANFFRRVKNGEQKQGFPRFKSKRRSKKSFRLTGTIRVFEKSIQLPRLGRLRLKEGGYLPVEGTETVHVLSATVSQRASRWYVSIQVEEEIDDPKPEQKPAVGVDLGIRNLAVLSDGTTYSNPRALKRNLGKIKRLQRIVSRRQKGSRNREKAVSQLAKAHARVTDIRTHTLHQITSELAKTKSVIVIEDLNVSGMMKNHRLAQAIGDVGLSEFKEQLAYKAVWYGSELVVIDRWFPSSKLCSACGTKMEKMPLHVRDWICPICNTQHDRDVNAAINILKKGLSLPSVRREERN
jgi:putative transposase